MDQERVRLQIKEQVLALAAAGVRGFERPAQWRQELNAAPAPLLDPRAQATTLPRAMAQPQAPGQSQTPALHTTQTAAQNTRCAQCVREARLGPVTEAIRSQKRYFALAEFPESGDELCKPLLFSNEKTTSHLLGRLFEKLGIQEQLARSYAVKCVPKAAIPNLSSRACGSLLVQEIASANPEFIFAFGARALASLEQLSGARFEVAPEIGEAGAAVIAGASRRVLVFPSVLELQAFPEWRSAVWAALQPFRARV